MKGLLSRRISAAGLILIFLLCNTPLNVLHYLFANHQDQRVEITYDQHNARIYKSGISCHLVGNVISEPFLSGQPTLNMAAPISHSEVSIEPIAFHFHPIYRHTDFRAPPVIS